MFNAVFLVEIKAWRNVVPAQRAFYRRADNGIDRLLILVFYFCFCGMDIDINFSRVYIDKQNIQRVAIIG